MAKVRGFSLQPRRCPPTPAAEAEANPNPRRVPTKATTPSMFLLDKTPVSRPQLRQHIAHAKAVVTDKLGDTKEAALVHSVLDVFAAQRDKFKASQDISIFEKEEIRARYAGKQKGKGKGGRQKLSEARVTDWAELEARELEAREQDRLAEEKEAEKAKKAKQRAEKKAEKAEKAKAKKAEKAEKAEKAKKPTGTRQKVCFSLRPFLVESSLIFLCRNNPLPRFLLDLLNLSPLGTKKRIGRRVWRAVVGLRGSGSLVGGSAVGRVVWSGFGASLMELGSTLGALDVFLIPDDSLLFSTISRCLVSSLVVIGRLVVEISTSRLPPPSLHALMQGGRKYVADEGYVTCSIYGHFTIH
jgi:hypothetical protein